MPKVKNIIAALPEPEILDLESLKAALADGSVELVCVLGPTASGKTRYAVQLAHVLGNAEIISADSRQVYRRMDIGTGKDLSEYGNVPFHLIDITEPGTQYNVHRFCEDFKLAFNDIRSRGAVPILCGGTGLYISAVTGGYDFRERKPLSAAPKNTSSEAPKTFFIGTLVSRELRNKRIDARLDARLAEGMTAEIQGLLDEGVPPEVLISYGLEYKFVTLYMTGQLDYPQMRERLAIAIHQFAKRQMTWFRGMERSGVRIHWVDPTLPVSSAD
ncbi:MAG: tRNA dimethylallyltransferase [Bacteroidales bacterium]|nr:tRNA dimethylallyltransferase [Bacteroidales bacterium]